MGKTSTLLTEWVQGAAHITHLTDATATSTAKAVSPAWRVPMI